MNQLAKPGEIILYTGKIDRAINETTIGLMRKNLVIGKRYTVKDIILQVGMYKV